MKFYKGIIPEPMDWRVRIIEDGSPARMSSLPLRLDVMKHSPSGFAWGYPGSGPAQLALAILCDAIGAERARPLYQQFKAQKIATLKEDASWTMSLDDVLEWVAEHEMVT